MRKINLLFAALVAFFCSSCTSYYWIVPPYTSVDKIAQLKPGMSINEVNNTLGISPYNIYHIQDDGGSVLTYNYRIKNRRVSLPSSFERQTEFKASEESQSQGNVWYENEQHVIYVLFKDMKFKSMMSDEGISKSEFLLIKDNNLRIISKKEYNSLLKISGNKSTNLLILNDKNTIEKVDLPQGEKDESNSIIIKDEPDAKNKLIDMKKNTTIEKKKGSGGAVLGILGAVMLIGLIAAIL